MKSIDRDRFDLAERITKRILAGEKIEKHTGRLLINALPEEDRPVPMLPEDSFVTFLSEQMAGAVPPDGTFPFPSEVEIVLDRLEIRHPWNRYWVRETLLHYYYGRAEGAMSEIERPKPPPK